MSESVGEILQQTEFLWPLIGGLAAGLATSLTIVKLTPIAKKLRLLDQPFGRKQHLVAVPPIGGLCIALGIGVGLLVAPFGWAEFRYLGLAGVAIVLVGSLDDLREVSVRQKIVAQFLISLFLVMTGGLAVSSVGDIFGWNDGNEQGLGWLSQPFTIIAIVTVVNALNLIDGHDGLAGGIFFISIAVILFFLLDSGEVKLLYLGAVLLSTISVFLFFNLGTYQGGRFKIFLGDAGSTMVGLILAYLVIRLSVAPSEDRVISPTIVPWIVGLPVLDMAAVLWMRFAQGVSVALPDRQHIHHQLLDRGWSGAKVLTSVLGLHACLIIVGVVGHTMVIPDVWLFWGFVAVGLAYITLRVRKWP